MLLIQLKQKKRLFNRDDITKLQRVAFDCGSRKDVSYRDDNKVAMGNFYFGHKGRG